ncbi:hypothetical protein [Spirulina subsalsa]|uniref:hypothetical protein n=2 Tax=Spirulinaceae TaxID=1890448 RepID=UPI00232E563B|nr:hypothetical protein [Spirulina subsalsa]
MRSRLVLMVGLLLVWPCGMAGAMPPPEDTPEEVLRTEIILEARSPQTGERLTAADYAQVEAAQGERAYDPELDPQVRHLIFLLQLRNMLKPIIPFIP